MNILQISVNDYGGCAYYLAEAITATTRHVSTSVRTAPPSYIGYATHLAAPRADDLRSVWEWADVVHVHDVCPPLPPGCKPKPTVITYPGSMYRRNPHIYNDHAARQGWLATVATLDLTAHGLPWMPDTRPALGGYVARSRTPLVAHAPTSRVIKDTEAVIKAVEKAGVALDVIEFVDYETCLRRKGRAWLYVDQFRLCYGLNAVEAWAMGQPVIANAAPRTLRAIRDVVGFVPFHVSTLDELPFAIERLLNESALYEEYVLLGADCYRRFHAPDAAAAIALSFYERAMAGEVSVCEKPSPILLSAHVEHEREPTRRRVGLNAHRYHEHGGRDGSR